MYSLDDTIVAISTPLGEGGIGIVRMTGPSAVGILHQLFVPAPQARPALRRGCKPRSFEESPGNAVD